MSSDTSTWKLKYFKHKSSDNLIVLNSVIDYLYYIQLYLHNYCITHFLINFMLVNVFFIKENSKGNNSDG